MFFLGQQERLELIIIVLCRDWLGGLLLLLLLLLLSLVRVPPELHLLIEQLIKVEVGIKVHRTYAIRASNIRLMGELRRALGAPRIERFLRLALRARRATEQVEIALAKGIRCGREELVCSGLRGSGQIEVEKAVALQQACLDHDAFSCGREVY